MNDLIDSIMREMVLIRNKSVDNLIACYLTETGLKASEIELVEETGIDDCYQQKTIWYCRPRKIGDK